MAFPLPPLPRPSLDDKAHWEGLRRHQLLIQKCADCGVLQHPPRPLCPRCHSKNREWIAASGKGTVYTYTIVAQATHPAWRDRVPYNVIVVALEEEVRVIGNLVGIANEEIRVGLPVEILFEDLTPEVTLPRFRPAGRPAER